jgi:hypothetical protein
MNHADDKLGELKVESKKTSKSKKRSWKPLQGIWEPVAVAEEVTGDANEVNGSKFGGSTNMIWDSGAGRSILNNNNIPGYKLEDSDHPGFAGPSGETIKVDGKCKVRFSDELAGTMAETTFIVAPVTRPLLSGG